MCRAHACLGKIRYVHRETLCTCKYNEMGSFAFALIDETKIYRWWSDYTGHPALALLRESGADWANRESAGFPGRSRCACGKSYHLDRQPRHLKSCRCKIECPVGWCKFPTPARWRVQTRWQLKPTYRQIH